MEIEWFWTFKTLERERERERKKKTPYRLLTSTYRQSFAKHLNTIKGENEMMKSIII